MFFRLERMIKHFTNLNEILQIVLERCALNLATQIDSVPNKRGRYCVKAYKVTSNVPVLPGRSKAVAVIFVPVRTALA